VPKLQERGAGTGREDPSGLAPTPCQSGSSDIGAKLWPTGRSFVDAQALDALLIAAVWRFD